MRTFVALSRTRNFRRAAEQLNTTQPAVSSRLAGLEAAYGRRLIDRGAGVFRLTEAGEQVLRGFESALAVLDCTAARLAGEPAPGIAPLRIGAIDTVAATWMPELIERLHARFPSAQIELTVDGTASLLAALKAGRLDVALAIQPLIDDGFRSFSPCVLRMIWTGAPKAVDPARSYTPRDLARLPIVSFPRGSPPFLMVAPYFQDEQVLASKLTFCNSLYAIVNLIIDGFGVAALPAVTVRRELKGGSLCALQVSKHFPSMPIVASYQALTRHETIREVADMIRTTARDWCQQVEPGMAWQE